MSIMKKFKMIFPAMAIIFAVAASFATSASSITIDDQVSFRGGQCALDGTCTREGSTQCQSGTILLDLFTPGNPNPSCAEYTTNGTFHAI
jgi:hypothetical protein